MVTADRSAPLRRVGSLLGLLGLEVAAVAALHWLGRLPALRIPWERPLPWLLDSPVQDVLGSLVRMVGLVMAYWLLASSLVYLLASMSHLPAAVRAVRWLTLPLVRRVADHALAVTLATSMVGGGTLVTAGPASAAPGRGTGVGPPARRPVASAPAPGAPRRWAAAQPTSGTASQDEPSQPRYRPRPAGQEPTTTGQDQSTRPRYRPRPAGQEPSLSEPAPSASEPETTPPSTEPTTTGPTTSQATTTTEVTTTTAPAASVTGPSTTTATTNPPSAQPAPTTTLQPTTAEPATTATTGPAGGGTAGSGRQGRAAGQPSTTTTTLRPPAYRFRAAGTTTTTTTTTTTPEAGQGQGQSGGEQGSGSKSGSSGGGESGGQGQSGAEQATSHQVVQSDNLWAIARDHLAEVRGRRAVELSDREIAAYWVTVVEANRGRLRSRDPDLIYPGEVVELPPVSGS
jgi:uncharacterized membrane protein YgcG